jgi:DNA topoisomerase-1
MELPRVPKPSKKPATAKPAKAKPTKQTPARKKAAAAPMPNGDAAEPKAGKYDLVVVESPTKAKTINKYLGPGYRVLASYGHVRDLDTHKKKGEEVAGIRIADGWKMRYVVDDGSDDGPKGRGKRRTPAEILAEIKREAAKANRVLLASDPDREGESIAWHIVDELKLPAERTFRITFQEITKNAIQKALAAPEKINQDRVFAQEARRAMDRVVGFPLSNLLGKKVAGRLSAGRVQSVAGKQIVDREREIEALKTEE